MIEEQGYVDISNETRDIEEISPDRWFVADKVKTPIELEISHVFQDPLTDDVILQFANDERWLKATRDMRLVLKSRFGVPAAWVGKRITILARPNWRRQYFISILPPELEPPKTTAIDPPAPKASRKKRSTDEVNDK